MRIGNNDELVKISAVHPRRQNCGDIGCKLVFRLLVKVGFLHGGARKTKALAPYARGIRFDLTVFAILALLITFCAQDDLIQRAIVAEQHPLSAVGHKNERMVRNEHVLGNLQQLCFVPLDRGSAGSAVYRPGGFMGPNTTMMKLCLWGSLLAGGTYLGVVAADLHGPMTIVWKGSGVALLAIFALLRARSSDGVMLAGVMALGALGDVLLDLVFIWGAVSFALGHILAVYLYRRNLRPGLSSSQRALGLVLMVSTPVIAWQMTHDVSVVGYALLLGLMAASAWTSRFSRYRVGLGAVMFVVSDLLIFARMGPLAGSVFASLAIWALYYGGQLLITLGVTQGLGARGRSLL